MKPTFLYIFPSNFEHAGLRIKAEGQAKALSYRYSVTLFPFLYDSGQSLFWKTFAYLAYNLTAFFNIFRHSVVYMRYNAKFPFLLLVLSVVSFFKPVYLEYNAFYDRELAHLKRYLELGSFYVCAFFLKRSKCHHFLNQQSLKKQFAQQGYTPELLTYFANGYEALPRVDVSKYHDVLDRIREAKKAYDYVGLYVATAQVWSDMGHFFDFFSSYSNVLIVLVGPYKYEELPPYPHVVVLGTRTPEEIQAISSECDFGIGHLNLGGRDGSDLKTREYLCNGLPVLIKYSDPASEIPELAPYFFNLETDPNAVSHLFKVEVDREQLRADAAKLLSWDAVFTKLFSV